MAIFISHPTFILARSTSDFGLTSFDIASGLGARGL